MSFLNITNDELAKKTFQKKVNFTGIEVDMLINLEEKSDHIFFCFAGAKPEHISPPYFNRWKWSNIFHSNIVAISDYTLKIDNKLQIGWYINQGENNIFFKLSETIKKVALELGYHEENIILYGSSAGGFAALKLAEYLPLAKCIAINPQTNIKKYYKSYYDKLTSLIREVNLSNEKISPHIKNALIVQNEKDTFHYQKHFKPYINENRDIDYYLYSHPNGHSAEPKEIIPFLIIKTLEKCYININEIENIEFNQLEIKNIHKDGNSINENWIEFKPQGRKELTSVTLNFPIEWNTSPFNDRNWKFQLNMWRFLDNALYQYDVDKNISHIIPIRKILIDWHDYHHKNHNTNEFIDKDMAVGARAMRLAYYVSADATYIKQNNDFKRIIEDIIFDHLIFLINIENIAYSNHTLTDIHGLMALSKLLPIFFKKIIENYIDIVFPKMVDNQFTESGFHKENSPEYHFFAIKCFNGLKKSQWFEKYNLSELLNKANTNKNLFYMPDGRILPFGDSTNKAQPSDIKVVNFKNDHQLYDANGYLIFKKALSDRKIETSTYLAINGCLNSRFHKHNDNLSFIWFEGEDIIRDFGKFAYKSSKFRTYAMSTASHNTIEFNSKNFYSGNLIQAEQFFNNSFKKKDYSNDILNIESSITYSSGLEENNISGLTHQRNFILSPSKNLIIKDKITGHTPDTIKQYFHLSHQWKLVSASNSMIKLISDKTSRFLTIKLSEHVGTLSYYYGSDLPLQGWTSIEYGEAIPSVSIEFIWLKGIENSEINFCLE